MSTTLQNTLQSNNINRACSCPHYHTTQFPHFFAPWYSECLVMPRLRQSSTFHHEGSRAGSRFTTGLCSRIFGCRCPNQSVLEKKRLRPQVGQNRREERGKQVYATQVRNLNTSSYVRGSRLNTAQDKILYAVGKSKMPL